MLPSKSLSIKVFCFSAVAAVLFLSYSFVLKDMLHLETDQTIHILDQEASATILNISQEKKSELLKGSILDYEGIYVSYKFQTEDATFQKTELIKKSENKLTDFLKSYDHETPSSTKMLVRYNSNDPRHSAIDFSHIIASF